MSSNDGRKSKDTKRGTNADIWIAGAVAAFTVDLIVYPLDTLKTRLQSPDYHVLYRNGTNTAFNPSMFRGLYQGVGSVIIATLPSSGAFFTTYEAVKATLSDLPHSPSSNTNNPPNPFLPAPLIHATASGTAELVSCAILTPAEVIKQNAQILDPSRSSASSSSSSSGPRVNATLATLSRFRSNPFALWRGYTALASRNLPFTALQFPLFERIKDVLRQRRDERGTRTHSMLEGAVITAVSAGTGGSIAAVITTPVDVVKTRIMLAAAEGAATETKGEGGGGKREKGIGAGKGLVEQPREKLRAAKEQVVETVKNVARPATRKSSMDIAREIIRDQGVKGLFRGGALRAVWTMLGSGLYLGVYETGRLYLANRRGETLDEDDLA